MTRQHSSYLLRCWRLDGDIERIEVEHIQSGAKTLATSVAEAIDWVCRHGVESTKGTQDDEGNGTGDEDARPDIRIRRPPS